MKNLVTAAALALVLAGSTVAQQQPGQAQQPAAQPQQQPGQAQQPAAQPQQQPGQGQQPAEAAQQPVTPTGKQLPQAQSQEEFDAFVAIATNEDMASAEQQADQFVRDFPDSQLRGMVYRQLMQQYQQANNADKMVEMGRRALEYDPNDPVPLIMVGTVLAERTRETDLDRDERQAEAMKYAQRGLETLDANLLVPADAPPDQVAMEKRVLASMAHAAMGTVELNRKDAASAEKHLQEAVKLNTEQPDALTWLRLSMAQDQQKKYSDALASANQAVKHASANPQVMNWAVQQRDRLAKLAGGAQTPAQPGQQQAPQTQPQSRPPSPPQN